MTAQREVIDRVWSDLISATSRRDGPGALQAARPAQEIGLLRASADAVLLGLAQDSPGAQRAASQLAEALNQRGWVGDLALAGLLTSTAAQPTGRDPLTVDLDGLADVLSDGVGGWLDLETGFAWPQEIMDGDGPGDIPGPDEEPDRWLEVGFTGSGDPWQDMADFVSTVSDSQAGQDLQRAIEGKGAFKRFQTTMDRHPELCAPWRVHSHERRLGRARQWLTDNSYDSIP